MILSITDGSDPPLYAFIISIYTIDMTTPTTGIMTKALIRLKIHDTKEYPKYSAAICNRWVDATIAIIINSVNTLPLVIAKLNLYDLNVLNPFSKIKNGKNVILIRMNIITNPVSNGCTSV